MSVKGNHNDQCFYHCVTFMLAVVGTTVTTSYACNLSHWCLPLFERKLYENAIAYK